MSLAAEDEYTREVAASLQMFKVVFLCPVTEAYTKIRILDAIFQGCHFLIHLMNMFVYEHFCNNM